MKGDTIKYIVMGVEKSHEVDLCGYRRDLPLVWADRMCGVAPVFKTKKAAEKYAGKKYGILKVMVAIEKEL